MTTLNQPTPVASAPGTSVPGASPMSSQTQVVPTTPALAPTTATSTLAESDLAAKKQFLADVKSGMSTQQQLNEEKAKLNLSKEDSDSLTAVLDQLNARQENGVANDVTTAKAGLTNPDGTLKTQTQIDAENQLKVESEKTDTINEDIKKQIEQFNNGTHPLTTAQQAQVDAISNEQAQAIAAQKIANENFTKGTELLGFRTGRATIMPSVAAGDIQSAVNLGNQKIAELNTKYSSAIADMEEAFQSNNFNQVSKSYDILNNIQKEKTTTLQKTVDDIKAATQKLKDDNYKKAQDQITNTLNNDKFTWQQKMDTTNAILKQQGLDETERHNKELEIIEQETADNGKYEVVNNPDGTQSIFDKSTRQVVGTPTGSVSGGTLSGTDAKGNPISIGNTGIPLLDTNTKTTLSGVPYIDGTNLTGKQATQVQLDAANLGIPYMGKTQSAALSLIDGAKNDVQDIKNSFMTFGALDATGRMIGSPDKALSKYLQTNDEVASFNAWRSAAIKTIQAIAAGGTGLRINQAEINAAMQYDIPTIYDTVGTSTAKLAKLSSMLENNERSIIGNDKYDWMKSATNDSPLKTYGDIDASHAKLISDAMTQNPDFTPSQIMQLLPGDISDWSFSISNKEQQ